MSLASLATAAPGHAVLAANLAVLERFEAAAEAFERAGHAEDAIATVELAAQIAAARHPGTHASPRLEAVLERIAGAHLPALPARQSHTGPRRVLHVATETYPTGGHSRMLWRWIARDERSVHTVVTTRQRQPPAEGVGEAARASGGRLVDLPADAPALERAAAVRALAGDADVVVVHAHPHDPAPALALAAGSQRPPVVVFNHGDHLFWLGAAIADALHCLRPAGAALALRRGIAPGRCLQGPSPVDGADDHGRSTPITPAERAAARAEVLGLLGWPADTVLLLSVGAPYKYDGASGTTLLELVEPVLRALPQARLLAVGPADEGAWRTARARLGGRVAAVGQRTGLGTVYAAADVYLESRPGGGPGACSEAAAHALPVLTHATSGEEAALYCTDARYGATVVVGPREYRQALRDLIADPARRAQAGAAARDAVAAGDDGWPAAMEAAYARAAAAGPASVAALDPVTDPPGLFDVLIERGNRRHLPLSDALLERTAAAVELAGRCRAVRLLYASLADAPAGPRSAFAAVFCAPRADAAELRTAVAEFRRMAAAGVAAGFVVAVAPDAADAVVAILEQALADAPELPVDLIIDEAPSLIRPPGAVELVLGEPASALAPYQYACPLE